MLGKDVDENEYWLFKEDLERIYIRMEICFEADQNFEGSNQIEWFYID